VERIEVGGPTREIRLAFPAPPRTGRRVVTLRDVHKAYGAVTVYAGIDLEVERGDRVVLVGVNGAGKSTLLRILAGVLPFDRGERTLGTHVSVHYYAQHQLDALDPTRTVLEEMEASAPEGGRTRLRTILGSFLFSGDDVTKKVAVLSGGEKARVALARMLVRPAPLLCLDEPTNHLDLASRERLEAALAAFPGTIVFISHDRYFINRLATRVLEIKDGWLTAFPGNYDDYRAAVDAPSPAGPGPVPAAASPTAAPTPPPPAARRRPRVDPTLRAMRRRLDALEEHIHTLEARLRELGEALGDPALYADGIRARAVTAERKEAEERVTWLMREWEDLSTSLAARN
jgi:ATP-binding cassette subfamily F protein 3